MDDLSSRAFISLKYILHYLPQLRLANNREGEKTTFSEISRIVLEITRQIYDGRERDVGHVVGSFVQRDVTFVSSQEESSNISTGARMIFDRSSMDPRRIVDGNC